MDANPGDAGCPTTVYDVKDGTWAAGALAIAGAKAMTKPCSHEPPSATVAITDWQE